MTANENMEKLADLKCELKAIVVSNQNVMRVNDLCRDYHEMIGSYIPVNSFGYKLVDDFIRHECSDTFKISGEGKNPILYPIITSNIKNINDLIVKQRKPTSNRRTPLRNSSYKNGNIPREKDSSHYFQASYPTKTTPRNDAEYRNNKKSFINRSVQNMDSNFCRKTEGTPTSQNKSTKKYDNLKSEIRQNVKHIIKNHPDGLWSADLMNAYFKKFKSQLEYEKIGYSNIISMCTDWSDIFSIQRPNKTGDWLLFDCDHKFNNTAKSSDFINKQNMSTNTFDTIEIKKNISVDTALPGITINPSLYSKDCMQLNDTMDRLPLLEVNSQVEVFISEALDPSHFWFQINSKEHAIALEDLMTEMENFYRNKHFHIRPIREMFQTVGLYCAVSYEEVYHRAVVVKAVNLDDKVKVLYIDYGTVNEVDWRDIHFLFKKFTHLPIQAMRGRLAFVKPVNDNTGWTGAVKRRFFYFIKHTALTANVKNVDEREKAVSITLVKKLKKRDIIIHKELFDEGLAEFELDDTPNAQKVYLLPAFDEIEKGDYFPGIVEPEFKELTLEKSHSIYNNLSLDQHTENDSKVDISYSYNYEDEPNSSSLRLDAYTADSEFKKNRIDSTETTKITLLEILEINDVRLEIWELEYKSGNQTCKYITAMIEQMCLQIFYPHIDDSFFEYIYSNTDNMIIHCVMHSNNLSSILRHLDDNQMSGMNIGESTIVDLVNPKTITSNYENQLFFINLYDIVPLILFPYNSQSLINISDGVKCFINLIEKYS